MFVQRYESTQCRGSKEREDDGVTRTVALEHFGLHERLGRARAELLAHLFFRLPECERFRLRKEVG